MRVLRHEFAALDRRDLLARGLAAGALLGLGSMRALAQEAGASAAPPAPARRYRKAVKLGMVQADLDLAGKFARLAELGFDGVELDGPSDLDPAEVQAARDASGLAIPGIVLSTHWQKPFSDPDAAVRAAAVQDLETALRDAARYGASTVLVVPGVCNADVSYEQAWSRSIAEIGRTLPLAEELDVRIAFENVWNDFITDPKEAARYVDLFESDRVGWYFDVGNAVRYSAPATWVPILGARILKLDIKEYSNELREKEGLWAGFRAELLEGSCDWPAVLKALDAIGYSGWGTAEIPGGGRDRLADIAARMDRIFAS